MSKVYSNILDMVGNTPLLKINNIDTGICELFVKLENLNPGGCLLYTSPSPRDSGQSRMPSSA